MMNIADTSGTKFYFFLWINRKCIFFLFHIEMMKKINNFKEKKYFLMNFSDENWVKKQF